MTDRITAIGERHIALENSGGEGRLHVAHKDRETLLSELTARDSEIEGLREALFALYNMAGMLKFEPDEGQPHPLKDGVYDKIMTHANRLLQSYNPQSSKPGGT